jgi:Amt family ammonium transporter
MMYIVNQLPNPWKLRIEAHGEVGVGGIDAFDHGIEAYSLYEDDVILNELLAEKGIKTSMPV